MGESAQGSSETESCLWKYISYVLYILYPYILYKGQFSRYLSSLRPIIFVSHISVICFRTHKVCTHTLAKMDLEVKASGRSKAHYGLELSSDFWPKEPFCACVVFSLILHSDRVLPLFVLTGDKDWLLTLLLLLLQFLRANRRLVVNSSTGTHLCCLRKSRVEAGWLWISDLEPIYLLPHCFLEQWKWEWN